MPYLDSLLEVAGRAPEDQGARTDRRARTREGRREAVFRAAVTLSVEQGFEATTMEQIADRADVARATVFNYYIRKTAFLEEWTARRRLKTVSALMIDSNELEHKSVADFLERYMIELAHVSERARAETVALMKPAVKLINVLGNTPLANGLARVLEAAKTTGEISSAVDAELAGLLMATGYFAVLTSWIDVEPVPFDLRGRLVDMLHLSLYGILHA